MKLNELAFYCVKNAIFYDDNSFTIDNFTDGDYSHSVEFSNQINNVGLAINEAIARISDLDKIRHRIENATIGNDGMIDLYTLGHSVKKVKGVAFLVEGDYLPIRYREMGDKVFIKDHKSSYPCYIEYAEDMPYFQDIMADNVNLSSYGITNAMCNYIMEYAMGRLLETIDPTMANLHITRAEQYFSGLNTAPLVFHQTVVARTYTIGG